MIANINLMGLFDESKKDDFITFMRTQNNIPFMYTKKKNIIKLVQDTVNNNLMYNNQIVIGVMICVQYEKNEFKC